MTTPAPSLTLRLRQQRRIVALLLILLILLALLPGVVRLAGGFALELLIGGQVTIRNVDINFFRPSLTVEALEVQLANARLLKVERLDIEVDGWPWRERQLVIKRVEVDAPQVTVEQFAQGGIRIAGVLLPSASEPSPPPSEPSSSGRWGISLESLQIRDAKALFLGDQLRAELRLDSLDLSDIDSRTPERPLTLELSGHLNDAPLSLALTATPLASLPVAEVALSLDTLELKPFARLAAPAVGRLGGRLTIDSRFRAERLPEQRLLLGQSGVIEINGIDVAVAEAPLSVTSQISRWNGEIDAHLDDPLEQAKLTLSGELSDQGLELVLPTQQLKVAHQRFGYRGEVSLDWRRGGDIHVDDRGEFELAGLDLQQADLQLRNRLLKWRSQGRVDYRHDSGSPQLEVEGELDNRGLEITSHEPAVTLRQETLNWQVSLKLDDTDQFHSLSQLELGGLTLNDERHQLQLVSLKRLRLGQVAISRQPLLDEVAIDTIDLDTLRLLLKRNPDGSLQLPRPQSVTDDSDDSPPATNDEVAPSPDRDWRLQIGKIRLGGKSRFEFEDRSPKPPFSQTVELTRLEAGPVDTGNPDEPVPIHLEGRLNEFSQLQLDGQVSPFAGRPTLSVDATLRAYEMPQLSGYTDQVIGYQVTRGQLSTDAGMEMVAGKMDGEVVLKINKLVLHRPPDAGKGPLDDTVPIPLDTAISILQDRQGNIALSVPISGDIDNPEFDLQDAINIAISKGMRKAVLSYLSSTLQPFGALLVVADKIAGMPSGVRLDPLTFEIGAAAPTSDPAYPPHIATLLKERPKLLLKVCGVATESDRAELLQKHLARLREEKRLPKEGEPQPTINDPQLLELADRRAVVVKRLLINDHGANPEQLHDCPPLLDPDSTAKPRVELLI